MTFARGSLGAAYRRPLFFGLLTLVGFPAALFGDGIWDAISWLCLGTPVVAVAWYIFRSGGQTDSSVTAAGNGTRGTLNRQQTSAPPATKKSGHSRIREGSRSVRE
jgi:hypothetical protein